MMRGNEKKDIFIDDQDKYKFLKVFKEKTIQTNTIIYSYCLMKNHVHIVLKESEYGVSDFLKRICVSYAYYFNRRYRRVGHLFQDRFKSEAIEDDRYLLTVIRYVHNNPVKAKIVHKADEYKWSSVSEYIGENTFVNIEDIFSSIHKDKALAKKEFIRFSKDAKDDYIMDYDEEDTAQIKKTRDENIRKMYIDNKMKKKDIAMQTGVSSKTIQRVLKSGQ